MTDDYTNLVDYPDGATPLDPDELDGLKFKHVSTRGELDQLEQAGITEGLKWLDKQKNPDVLSEAFVLELHKRLFGSVWKWAGTFRRTEKNIGVDPIQVAIQLRQLLDDAKYWVSMALIRLKSWRLGFTISWYLSIRFQMATGGMRG